MKPRSSTRADSPKSSARRDQLPTTVFADVLNGLAECEAILAAMPQQETPPPVTKHVPEWLP